MGSLDPDLEKCWMFSIEGCLKASPVAWTSFQKFSAVPGFLNFWSSKPWIRISESGSATLVSSDLDRKLRLIIPVLDFTKIGPDVRPVVVKGGKHNLTNHSFSRCQRPTCWAISTWSIRSARTMGTHSRISSRTTWSQTLPTPSKKSMKR